MRPGPAASRRTEESRGAELSRGAVSLLANLYQRVAENSAPSASQRGWPRRAASPRFAMRRGPGPLPDEAVGRERGDEGAMALSQWDQRPRPIAHLALLISSRMSSAVPVTRRSCRRFGDGPARRRGCPCPPARRSFTAVFLSRRDPDNEVAYNPDRVSERLDQRGSGAFPA